MSILRKAAKGKPCMARIYAGETHNHDPATVVLHHCRTKSLFGIGLGQKPPDIFGAWVCAKCHDVLHDPTKYGLSEMGVTMDEYEAILRTQNELLKLGIIGIF